MSGTRQLLLAIALLAIPAWGQFGAPGGAGIPLGTRGAAPEEQPEKKNPAERSVHGTVTDAAGNPVSGALVELKNKRTQEIRSLITHDKGTYLFDGLIKDDDYQLTASLKDHASKPHTLSTYDPRPNPMVNLQLQ
ncbi:MAG TPA: carboxypeptidase-like regulatory domain-containing protein [Bryobacteraceae bacterium]|nr:carboxypeptidase-like regulatory domain-containing protein [Bryobacteraceae bacterium]